MEFSPVEKALNSQGGRAGPERFSDVYSDLYANFPCEQHKLGSHSLTLINVKQQGHQLINPGVPEIVFRLVVGGPITNSRVDFGDGKRALSGRKGSFYLAPANADADWHSQGDHELIMVAAGHSRVQELLDQGGASSDPLLPLYGCDLQDPTITGLMESIWRESQDDDVGRDLMVDGLFATLLVHLNRKAKTATHAPPCSVRPLAGGQLQRVLDFIESHLTQPLTVAELAVHAGQSEFHFSRTFQTAMGATPHAYVMNRRLERVRERLLHSNDSLAQIAHETGFSSQSHMSNRFKAVYAMTPGAYRREFSS